MALPPLEIAAPDHRATLCRVRIFVYLSKTIQNHAHYTIAKEVFQCARAYSSARAGGREGSLPFLLLSRSTPPTARHARRTAQCAAKDSPCRRTAAMPPLPEDPRCATSGADSPSCRLRSCDAAKKTSRAPKANCDRTGRVGRYGLARQHVLSSPLSRWRAPLPDNASFTAC